MLTRQGWVTAILSGAMLVTGRVLGTLELFVLGGVGAALVLVAALVTGASRLSLEVTRELRPPRLHAGATSRVHLRVRNSGRRRSPAVEVGDALDGARGPVLPVPAIEPGEHADLTYDLPTTRRGIVVVGPLRIALTDPFGLTRVVLDTRDAAELTVYPRVEPLDPLPRGRRVDVAGTATDPDALGRSAEEFYALRPYVVGDDMRRVHWASSARHDDLMVRQDTTPLQQRLTILADLRTDRDDRLEAIASAAASLVARCALDQEPVRLVTSVPTDSGMGRSRHHTRALLEHLAVVGRSEEGRWDEAIARLSRAGDGGTLVVLAPVPPGPDGDQHPGLEGLAGRYGPVLVLSPGEEAFADLWRRAVGAPVAR